MRGSRAALLVLALLFHAPMLGCSFESTSAAVRDEASPASSYACRCRCDSGSSLVRMVRIPAAADDAEQMPATGEIDADPEDLDLGVARTALRFAGVAIPPQAVIVSAHVQLTSDRAFFDDGASVTNLKIVGEAADDAAPFTTDPFDLSSRSATIASVGWIPPPWGINESGPAQRTPELRRIVQGIVDRPGWRAGNALALQISGVGRREAETSDDDPRRAATLEVEFVEVITRELTTCMSGAVSGRGPSPVDVEGVLRFGCEERAREALDGSVSACTCEVVANSRTFDAACDPARTATNATGDAGVCRADA